jgi:molecular chaperone DnaK (HSP70)
LNAGLDFGTSTTLAASPSGVIPIGESQAWMPSLVGYADDGSIVAGEQALDLPEDQLVRSVKRFITEGRQFVQLDTPAGLRDVRADDLMTEMLREAHRRASLENAEITLGCPAMWDGPQRRRLEAIARRAGLNVTLANIVDEPVAAGIAWLSQRPAGKRKPLRALVFDMGGGTLDIAVLDIDAKDEVSVLAAVGVAEAGNTLDEAVAEDLEFVLAAAGISLGSLERPRRARARLHYAAQNAKISLSTVEEIDVKLPRREFGIASIPYSREQLNEMFSPQMDRAEAYLGAALRIACLPSAAGGSVHDIARMPIDELAESVDVVVLSGGMSQVPYVTQRLSELFPRTTKIELASTAPEHAVAMGLAKATAYSQISKYRPAFDILLEWDNGKESRTVYEAYTPLLEMRQIAKGGSDLRFVRTGRQLNLPNRGKGQLRVVSHTRELVTATLGGSNLDGFLVALSSTDFEFSLYPNGHIHLADANADYNGNLKGWS